MSAVSDNPVLTTGTIAGILIAVWNVVVAQQMLDGLTDAAQAAVQTLVNLLIPIIAALVARQFVTPVANPNLPIGTEVNKTTEDPTGVVVPK